MELFRTIFSVPVSEKKITYKTPVMFTGSCFSEHIGNKLSESKIITDNNPFGIIYNPLSLKKGVLRLLSGKAYETAELFNYGGVWGNFDHHSRFSGITSAEALGKINERFKFSSEFILNTKFLFITFGTAYVYTLRKTGEVVSNCHKFPAADFNRSVLTVSQIVEEYSRLLEEIQRVNSEIEIVFTVSPVRHWKDGAHENQLSKSVLLLAIDEICKNYNHVFYFPSYELVMDDLRDYRFYAEDMLHPNKIAIDYIWGHFRDCFFESETIILMKEVEKIVQAAAHRPFNAGSELYLTFARQTLAKIKLLKDEYGIPFNLEEKYFESLMKK